MRSLYGVSSGENQISSKVVDGEIESMLLKSLESMNLNVQFHDRASKH